MPSPAIVMRFCLFVGVSVSFASIAWSAEEHAHDGHVKSSPGLVLNSGRLWQTDVPLRKGMDSIRHDMEAVLPRIHDATLSNEHYAILVKGVRGHIEYMVKNCKLSPEADAQLHGVLAEIIAGADAMEDKASQSSGAVRIIQALNSYGRHFDHPGWRPVTH
ncbi:MAG: hypothetical protein HQL80_09475 [Magnetococcales bacterium]|nr:hypothetical protein [Magnetococcales bacterium]